MQVKQDGPRRVSSGAGGVQNYPRRKKRYALYAGTPAPVEERETMEYVVTQTTECSVFSRTPYEPRREVVFGPASREECDKFLNGHPYRDESLAVVPANSRDAEPISNGVAIAVESKQ